MAATMMMHRTGTRDEWLAARLELLEAEKDLTRRGDELARQRQALPWVRVRQGVPFETDDGTRLAHGPLQRTLAAPRLSLHVRARLHGGLSVLLGHCGRLQRLLRPPREPRRDAFGRLARTAREAARVQAANGMGLPVGVLARQRLQFRLRRRIHPRRSSARGSSNTTTSAAATRWMRRRYPARSPSSRRHAALTPPTYTRDRPGVSAFVLEDGLVYHTYSAYARGLDGLWGMYQWLDRAPKGRNETGVWWNRHDEYDNG